MKLSDIMGDAGFVTWAEAGLIISLVTFTAILIYVFVIRSRASFEEARLLPLYGDGDACQVRRFRRFADSGLNEPEIGASESSESSDLARPEVS